MIQIENVTKRFGSFTAVRDISITVPEGSIFAFLGTNGAGKTTTIRMITGVINPTSGRILVGGYPVTSSPVQAKSLMGVIPDRPHLYGRLSGREFLQFMAELYRVPRLKASERIEYLLAIHDLLEWQHELIDTYSHGMKQRLMMCGAQIHEPKVLIIDEPMVGLDPPAARMFKDHLRECAKNGQTIFMSTHSLSVAEEIAHTLAIIQRGRILASGTLDSLYSRAQHGANGLEKVFLDIINESGNSNNSGQT
ncbi:MAG TPA: ABC transporter ATP-binding protein [Oligoflexia bacterium]|nr:ABC transporter ATP-binding protein [Oligoflexia bacterium]HMP48521.1 ABC transporter ATP-binding protein [Oligoflexia bacterium]